LIDQSINLSLKVSVVVDKEASFVNFLLEGCGTFGAVG
jgi:hypothetical protein